MRHMKKELNYPCHRYQRQHVDVRVALGIGASAASGTLQNRIVCASVMFMLLARALCTCVSAILRESAKHQVGRGCGARPAARMRPRSEPATCSGDT